MLPFDDAEEAVGGAGIDGVFELDHAVGQEEGVIDGGPRVGTQPIRGLDFEVGEMGGGEWIVVIVAEAQADAVVTEADGGVEALWDEYPDERIGTDDGADGIGGENVVDAVVEAIER